MTDFHKSVKLSLIYGFIGAVLVPLLYEVYANISKTAGMVLVVSWFIYGAIRFCFVPLKEAAIGITCCIGYTGILGVVMYVIIHPAIQSFLESHSKYYYLTIQDEARFFIISGILLLCMYVVNVAKYFVAKTIKKIKGNQQKAGEYIDNAFADDEKEETL